MIESVSVVYARNTERESARDFVSFPWTDLNKVTFSQMLQFFYLRKRVKKRQK